MAQLPHDIMISSVENEIDAEFNLWSILTPLEREFQVDVEWLNVHPASPNIRTTYAFLRFADPSIHPRVVQKLNGKFHRGRYLHVRINPLPTPEHRVNPTYSPRVQVEISKLVRREREWLEEKAMLQAQLRASNERVEHFMEVETQLHEEINRVQNSPLHIEINSIHDEIQQLKNTISKWRADSSKTGANQSQRIDSIIEAGERKLANLQADLSAKQQQLFDLNHGLDELKSEIDTLRAIISDLTHERERLLEQNQNLASQNQELETQLQTLRQQITEQGQVITNLRTENETIRRTQLQSVASVVSCPVCYEPSTQRAMTVLFCGHVLCENCRHIINRGRENRHCPTCRRGDLTVYIQLFL